MPALIILGFIVLAAGIVGCVLPIIPGPPLAYAALVLLSIARGWEAVSPTVLIVGMIFFPPFGVIAGYFLRAVLRG